MSNPTSLWIDTLRCHLDLSPANDLIGVALIESNGFPENIDANSDEFKRLLRDCFDAGCWYTFRKLCVLSNISFKQACIDYSDYKTPEWTRWFLRHHFVSKDDSDFVSTKKIIHQLNDCVSELVPMQCGLRPIHVATIFNMGAVIKHLLLNPGNSTLPHTKCPAPVLFAVVHGHAELTQRLLNENAKEGKNDPLIDRVHWENHTLLSAASFFSRTNVVKVLLKMNANHLYTNPKTGCNALHYAVSPILPKSDAGILTVKVLTENCTFPPHALDRHGSTYLMRALDDGNTDIVNHIKENNLCNAHTPDSFQVTPFMVHCCKGELIPAKQLYQQGTNYKISTVDGRGALHMTVSSTNSNNSNNSDEKNNSNNSNNSNSDNDSRVLKWLFSIDEKFFTAEGIRKCDVKMQRSEQKLDKNPSPIEIAAFLHKTECVKILIEKCSVRQSSLLNAITKSVQENEKNDLNHILFNAIDWSFGVDEDKEDEDEENNKRKQQKSKKLNFLLRRAGRGGNITFMKKFIDLGAQINLTLSNYLSPLSCVISSGSSPALQFLLNSGASFSFRADGKEYEGDDEDEAEYYEEKNEDYQRILAFKAVRGKNVEVARLLHQRSLCFGGIDNNETTTFHIACQIGDLEMVRFLHRECRQAHFETDYDGFTPWQHAIMSDRAEVLEYLYQHELVKSHASLDESPKIQYPLHFAFSCDTRKREAPQCFKIIFNHIILSDDPTINFHSSQFNLGRLLLDSIEFGLVSIIETILQQDGKFFDINDPFNEDGEYACMFVSPGDVDTARCILRNGFDVAKCVEPSGVNWMTRCIINEDYAILEVLLSEGVSADLADEKYSLQHAVDRKVPRAIRLLLRFNASLTNIQPMYVEGLLRARNTYGATIDNMRRNMSIANRDNIISILIRNHKRCEDKNEDNSRVPRNDVVNFFAKEHFLFCLFGFERRVTWSQKRTRNDPRPPLHRSFLLHRNFDRNLVRMIFGYVKSVKSP